MIYNYPYFGFPRYMSYMRNSYSPNQFSSSKTAQHNSFCKQKQSLNSNVSNNLQYKKAKEPPPCDLKPFFNIFGINLYFDDVLLICLIFFLYNEKVDDTYLLLCLVLLLLS